MQTVVTIGLDLAKSVFQVHCVDGNGVVVMRRALRRSQILDFFRRLPPCLVGPKPVPPRITGRGRSALSVIRCV
jgi:transposase